MPAATSQLVTAGQETRGKVNLCPFECTEQDLDQERGYCKHLVGFTQKGKLLEPLEYKKAYGQSKTVRPITGGRRQKVEKKDVLVLMENGYQRVYRKDFVVPGWVPPMVVDAEDELPPEDEV